MSKIAVFLSFCIVLFSCVEKDSKLINTKNLEAEELSMFIATVNEPAVPTSAYTVAAHISSSEARFDTIYGLRQTYLGTISYTKIFDRSNHSWKSEGKLVNSNQLELVVGVLNKNSAPSSYSELKSNGQFHGQVSDYIYISHEGVLEFHRLTDELRNDLHSLKWLNDFNHQSD
jgi:hypothetical protein